MELVQKFEKVLGQKVDNKLSQTQMFEKVFGKKLNETHFTSSCSARVSNTSATLPALLSCSITGS